MAEGDSAWNKVKKQVGMLERCSFGFDEEGHGFELKFKVVKRA